VHPDLSEYVRHAGFGAARSRRMVNGLRVLQEIAANGDQPITYTVFVGTPGDRRDLGGHRRFLQSGRVAKRHMLRSLRYHR